jgi:ABC-type transport system involved in Fe-S cluster assembly fused permease/ATPase subunit
MNLPDNYDFDVKERGVMLSSGQRQLISWELMSNLILLDVLEELIQRATETITQGSCPTDWQLL